MPQKVGSSAIKKNIFKSFRALEVGKLCVVTVRVTRNWEKIHFMCANDITVVEIVVVDEQVATQVVLPFSHLFYLYVFEILMHHAFSNICKGVTNHLKESYIKVRQTNPRGEFVLQGEITSDHCQFHVPAIKLLKERLPQVERRSHRFGCLLCVSYSDKFCFNDFEYLKLKLQNIYLIGHLYIHVLFPTITFS